MMYTFGDVRDPLPATAETMEEIVRAHIMKLVRLCCVCSCMVTHSSAG